MDKEMSLYNTELIKNIQKSSHANVNEDDRVFEFNLTDLVYHRWEYSQMNLFRHVLAHVKITLSFHLFLALPFLCSSSDTTFGRKKHVIQNNMKEKGQFSPGRKKSQHIRDWIFSAQLIL